MTETLDPQSGNEIRNTDNTLRDCDMDAPQLARPLTDEEVKQLLKEVGENGNS